MAEGMLHLDAKTIATMYVAVSAAMTVCVGVSFAGAFRRGVDKFFLHLLLQTIAWILLLQRGSIPDTVSVLLANVLLSSCLSFFLLGLFEFFERRHPKAVFMAPPLLTLLLFGAFMDERPTRVLLAGVIFGAQHLLAASFLILNSRTMRKRSVMMLASAQTLMAAVFIFRAMVGIVEPRLIPDLFHNSHIQGLMFSTGFVAMLLSSVAFILMQRERTEQELIKQATMDPLTGAFNRRVFETLAEKALGRARRENAAIYLLLLDLDHFKRVNDLHGHSTGDAVLKEFAARTLAVLRTQDILARLGGEEFGVLLVDAHQSKASVVAERIRLAMYRSPVKAAKVQHPGVRVTVSVGVAGGFGETSLLSLMERADRALYLAKSRGRNQVRHEMELHSESADPGEADPAPGGREPPASKTSASGNGDGTRTAKTLAMVPVTEAVGVDAGNA